LVQNIKFAAKSRHNPHDFIAIKLVETEFTCKYSN